MADPMTGFDPRAGEDDPFDPNHPDVREALNKLAREERQEMPGYDAFAERGGMRGVLSRGVVTFMGRGPDDASQNQAALYRKIFAGLSSAADPFGVPSAIAGAGHEALKGNVLPFDSLEGTTGGPTVANAKGSNIRDVWRAHQASEGLGPQIAGGVIGGGGAAKAALTGSKGALDSALRLGGLGASSDVVDQYAGGKDDAVNSGTALKAALGAVGTVPAKAQIYGGGALAAILGTSAAMPPAAAQQANDGFASDADRMLYKTLNDKLASGKALSRAERETLNRLGEGPAKAAAQRAAAKAREDERAADDKRDLDLKLVADARQSHDDVLAGTRRPFHETEIGGLQVGKWLSGAMPALPLVLGGLIGNKIGGAGAKADAKTLSAWEKALASGEGATVPTQKFDSAQTAKYLSEVFAPKQVGTSMALRTGGSAALGGAEGAVTSNLPEFYDSYLPDKNPKREALQAALDRLPKDHPEYVRMTDLIEQTPERNPDRVRAERHFLSGAWKPRAINGAGEGAAAAAGMSLARQIGGGSMFGVDPMRARTQALERQTGSNSAETSSRMASRAQVDRDFAGEQQRLAGARQLDDAAVRQAQVALAELENQPLSPEMKEALLAQVRQRQMATLQRTEPQSRPALQPPSDLGGSATPTAGKNLGKIYTTPEPIGNTSMTLGGVKDGRVAGQQTGGPTDEELARMIDEALRKRNPVTPPDQKPIRKGNPIPTEDSITFPEGLKPMSAKSGDIGNLTHAKESSAAVQRAILDHVRAGGAVADISPAKLARDLGIPRTRVIDAQDNLVKLLAANNVDHRDAKAVETFLQRLNRTSLGNTNQTGNRLVSIPAMIGSGIGVGATMDDQPLTPEQRDALEKLAARFGL